jgi:hypothetical protein
MIQVPVPQQRSSSCVSITSIFTDLVFLPAVEGLGSIRAPIESALQNSHACKRRTRRDQGQFVAAGCFAEPIAQVPR